MRGRQHEFRHLDSSKHSDESSLSQLRAGKIVEVFESISDAYFAVDRQWRLTYVNERALHGIQGGRSEGLTREDLLGQNLWELYPELVGSEFYHKYHEAVSEQKAIHFEGRLSPTDEWYEVHAYPFEEGLSVYYRTISERKRAKEELREASEERYRKLFEAIDEGFGVIEMLYDGKGRAVDYRILETNPAFGRMTGFANAVGKTSLELNPDAEPYWFETLGRVAETGEDIRFEHYAEALDRWFEVYASRMGAEGNRKVAIVFANTTERKRAEEALRESEERVRLAAEAAQMYTWEVDVTTQDVKPSSNAEHVLGFSPPLRVAETIPLIHPEDRDRVAAKFQHALRGEEKLDIECRLVNPKNNEIVWLRAQGLLIGGGDAAARFLGVVQNITNLKQAEEEGKQARNATLRADVSTALAEEGTLRDVLQKCAECTVHHLDAAFARIWTLEEGESVLKLQASAGIYTHLDGPHGRVPVGQFKIGLIAQERQPHLSNDVVNDPRIHDKEWVKREGMEAFAGHPLIVENRVVGVMALFTRRPIAEDTAEALASVADVIAQDMERRRAEERLRYQAYHDLLTGLPNRRLFVDRLEQALRRTERTRRRKVAVLYMDLDDFKVINDSLGHRQGDVLLTTVAERLRNCLRPEDTLARFGGDEFTVLIEDVKSPDDVVRIAERIVEALREPFLIHERELFVRATIGIAIGDARTQSSEELLRDADTAMYWVKGQEGRKKYEFFSRNMYDRVLARLNTENDLRRALGNDELVLYYQPIVHLRTGEAWGVEALLRWQHPEKGLLLPSQFVPLAEETGLILPIGNRVMEDACSLAKEMQQSRPRPLVAGINFSAKQLEHPDSVRTVKEVLRKTGLRAGLLHLDITETSYIRAAEAHESNLDQLKGLGACISIDDFGMGYSSLSYLKRLPADTLKVDKSFVAGLGEDVQDTAIVRMVIDLAHTFGMEVVAEGVESKEQAEQLREMGCDMAQGFYFAEPMPPDETLALLTG